MDAIDVREEIDTSDKASLVYLTVYFADSIRVRSDRVHSTQKPRHQEKDAHEYIHDVRLLRVYSECYGLITNGSDPGVTSKRIRLYSLPDEYAIKGGNGYGLPC